MTYNSLPQRSRKRKNSELQASPSLNDHVTQDTLLKKDSSKRKKSSSAMTSMGDRKFGVDISILISWGVFYVHLVAHYANHMIKSYEISMKEQDLRK